jgi:arginyl-tRNA synthetase
MISALNVRARRVLLRAQPACRQRTARIRTAINDLTFKGHVYKGKLPPPKGQLPEDWEDREQTLFRSTEVGDDIDRPLIKSDGSYTYFAADVAYFRDKFERGFSEMIYVLGADHGGYIKRLEAVARAVSAGQDEAHCAAVPAGQDLSQRRAGGCPSARAISSRCATWSMRSACDSVRFMMLYRKSSESLDFDFAKVTEQSKDNPVFYVQYAHARCASVMRQALEVFPGLDISPETLGAADLSDLNHESEAGADRKAWRISADA